MEKSQQRQNQTRLYRKTGLGESLVKEYDEEKARKDHATRVEEAQKRLRGGS